jgi:hypothetical protein
LKVSSGVIGNL